MMSVSFVFILIPSAVTAHGPGVCLFMTAPASLQVLG
jgi:hypothetical protein